MYTLCVFFTCYIRTYAVKSHVILYMYLGYVLHKSVSTEKQVLACNWQLNCVQIKAHAFDCMYFVHVHVHFHVVILYVHDVIRIYRMYRFFINYLIKLKLLSVALWPLSSGIFTAEKWSKGGGRWRTEVVRREEGREGGEWMIAVVSNREEEREGDKE